MATLNRLGIEPIGVGEVDATFTAHIEVELPTDTEPLMEESVAVAAIPVPRALQLSQTIPGRRLRQRAPGAAQGYSHWISLSAGPMPLLPTL
jgi:hypothetical protein